MYTVTVCYDTILHYRSVCEDLCVGGWRVVTNVLCLGSMAVFFWVLIEHGGLLDLAVTETCTLRAATGGGGGHFPSLRETKTDLDYVLC